MEDVSARCQDMDLDFTCNQSSDQQLFIEHKLNDLTVIQICQKKR